MRGFLPSKNVSLLIGVLLLCAAARFYADRTYFYAAQFDFQAPHKVQQAQQMAWILPLAIVGALVGSSVGYRLNRVTAGIMGPVGAAVATATYSSMIGAVVGTPIGILVAIAGPRRIAIVFGACTLATAAGAVAGVAAGVFSESEVSPMTWAAVALAAVTVVVALNIAHIKWAARRGQALPGRWRRFIGRTVLFALTLLLAVAAIPLGITLESAYRLRAIGGSSYTFLRRIDADCLTLGFINVEDWRAPNGIGRRELIQLRRFNGLRTLRLPDAHLDDTDLAMLGDWPALSHLSLAGTEITDASLRHLAASAWLWHLELDGTQVTGDGLAQLPCAPRLVSLSLNRTPAGDEALSQIGTFRALNNLQLRGTAVTDDGLAHLAKLPALRYLYLADTQISDVGLAKLASIRTLSQLDLSETRITDVGLPSLAKLPLSWLELRGTGITDAGVGILATLPALGRIDLSYTGISDASLDSLTKCRKLWYLGVKGTTISQDGIARLRQTLSDCTIEGPEP